MGVMDIKTGSKDPATALQIAAYVALEKAGDGDLYFDEERHIFERDGEFFPSVTQILRATGMSYDHSLTDPFYARRGTFVHKACELYDRGTLDPDTLDTEEVLPYWLQYIRAEGEFPFRVLDIEERLFHPIYRYAGIIDRIITGGKSYVLYLTKESFKLEEVKDIRSNFNVFASALNVYRWKQQYRRDE